MLRSFIPLAVVCVTSSMSLIYGVRYLIPAFIVAAMTFYDLRSEPSATKDAGRALLAGSGG
jgi:hypothetical protein